MHLWYGVLVGLAYTLPNSVAGLYAGTLTKTGNRKLMLIAVMVALSAMQFSNGLVNSFALIVVMRFLHGTISAGVTPLAFSLVADIFPMDKRNTANSIVSGANMAGIALSSMTIFLIRSHGWR